MMIRLILYSLLLLFPIKALAQQLPMRFQRLTYSDGLSDNKVNCILKSREGFIWIGTPMGLNRYDGFRVQSFYNKPGVPTTLPDNAILRIVEDAEGMLWLDTSWGFCIFNPNTDVVNRNTEEWMSEHGMQGKPMRVVSDDKGNLWIASSMGKLFYYNFASNKVTNIPLRKDVKVSQLSWLNSRGNNVYFTLNDGTVATIKGNRLSSVDRYVPIHTGYQKSSYRTYTGSDGSLWVWSQVGAFHYNSKTKRWKPLTGFVMSDVAENNNHRFLIATDHGGLIIADSDGNIINRVVNNPADNLSLPDNTLQCVYVDNVGVVWLGMYRMGLAHYYRGQNQFALLPLGDICSMTQATDGSLWLGTNDSGIRHYNFYTNKLDVIDNRASGLGTNVVVSSLTARDGSLWFGSFQGGMVRLNKGTFTHYDQRNSGLSSNDVWSLAELPDGRIAIATLGGGLQLLNPKTNRFTTYNTKNSKLPSDFISSVAVMKDGWIALGHSQGFSLFRLRDHKVITIGEKGGRNGEKLTSLSVNQVFVGNNGLLWIASGSGLNVYDKAKDRLYTVNLQGTRVHAEVNSVGQDRDGVIWLSIGNELKSVMAKPEADGWHFFSNTYGNIDGVQTRLFNKRSILSLRDGRILFGGIDGVNVVNPKSVSRRPAVGKVIFSGLSLFDHPVGVGDTINGHTILTTELNTVREISLRHDENTFSIQLASSVPGLPESPRFLYRLRGTDDRWLITSPSEPMVHFTNFAPGHYTLEVRSVDSDGNALNDVSVLKITVRPPFYLSVWAWIIYIVLAVLLIGYAYWRMKKNQRDELEKLELKKQKEVEEMKLVFFTNMGHELRTPLSLILSPLESIMSQVHDADLLQKLRLMQRNARKLLDLVNQMLDLRRMMRGKETLNLAQGDIVAFVRGICNQFSELSDKGITLTFHTAQDVIMTSFDQDKIGKIISNLLSNAYKFTPKGGRVDVIINFNSDGSELNIIVADNGPGVSDEDKPHLFERFYQSSANKKSGGSGIGLNLAWEYAKMHGGNLTVSDNDGGGAKFTVSIPVKKDVAADNAPVTSSTEKQKGQPVGYVTSFGSQLPTADKLNEDRKDKKSNDAVATILLVDDNDDFLNFLAEELSPYYNISTAKDGQQALDSINKLPPDLVLTDVMMPVMDGNELCKRIKSDAKTKQIPVIMLTARLSDENEIESRECGADDYVKKPFSLQLLKVRIDNLLAKDRINSEGKVKPRIAQPKITSEDEKFVDKATKYVEQHLDDTDLSVEQMAQDIGMSRVQLYRRLVTVVGKTPSEFIRLIRLRHAVRLLMESQLTVSEIAYKVGFSSQRYFSKCFKELYGYMPTEYKRMKS